MSCHHINQFSLLSIFFGILSCFISVFWYLILRVLCPGNHLSRKTKHQISSNKHHRQKYSRKNILPKLLHIQHIQNSVFKNHTAVIQTCRHIRHLIIYGNGSQQKFPVQFTFCSAADTDNFRIAEILNILVSLPQHKQQCRIKPVHRCTDSQKHLIPQILM